MVIVILSFSYICIFTSKILYVMIAEDQIDTTKQPEQARMQSQYNNISNQINSEYS